jgi:hypothetical protein
MNADTPTTQIETLARAIEIAGSTERLADFLCRPLAELEAWSSGMRIPEVSLLALGDIVSANELTIEALDRFQVRGRKPKRALLADLLI